MSSSITGVIAEFTDTSSVCIEIKDLKDSLFTLKVCPTTGYDNAFNITSSNSKDRYCATTVQAKQHIKDVLEIAKLSLYAPTHQLILKIPFYPNLVVAVDKMESVLPLINRVLDNYA